MNHTRRILLTSALPYINGIKHLGNAIGSMLPADVFARFQRARGDEVLFICATDEHGTPAELAAAAARQDVRTYCDEQHALQHDIYRAFGFSFDHFGRSSSVENRLLTQQFGERLDAAGLIEQKASRGLYCLDDGRFLPDRYVEGTCPICKTEGARGDQCDTCGSLLDPVDLIRPRSKISRSERIEVRETIHLFLRQSAMADTVRQWVDRADKWPRLATSIARKWLDEGLKDRSITRDLSWGVPVTKDGQVRPGFENKVYYVWFDAPICYIAATQEWAEATGNDWARWWRTDKGADDVTYIQVMGKDNVAFHTVSFPITLIGSGEPWKLVDTLKAFNWLNWYGDKFSTSLGRGIFMDKALDLLPADAWRWTLIANAPENSDTAFTLQLLKVAVNGDLANVLGNFVMRLTRFCSSSFEGVVPDGGTPGPREAELVREVQTHVAAVTAALEAMECRKAAAAMRVLWASANAYLSKAAPWVSVGSDTADAAMVVRTALGLMTLLARVSQPVIPHSSERIWELLPDQDHDRAWPQDVSGLLSAARPGGRVLVGEALFEKLTDDQVAKWESKFGGSGQAAQMTQAQ